MANSITELSALDIFEKKKKKKKKDWPIVPLL